MTPVPVDPSEIDEWVEPLDWHFKSFCRFGQWEPEDLLEDCRQKRRQLWVLYGDGVQGVVLTTVSSDRLKSLIVTHAAGVDRKAWLPFWGFIEEWAREIGCKRVEIIPRFGWERDLKELGLRKTHIVMEKRL